MNNINYLLWIVIFFMVILFIVNSYILFKIGKINKIKKDFFSGKNGKDLEGIILKNKKQIQKNKKDIEELFDAYEKIYKITTKGIQKIGIIRYNLFGDIGGNQSFAIALLDKNNSGLIISSFHTREGARLFAKSVIKGECPNFPLTSEEKSAIKNATISKKVLQI